jgi:hypothetical protein
VRRGGDKRFDKKEIEGQWVKRLHNVKEGEDKRFYKAT